MGQIAPSKLIGARPWRVGIEQLVEETGDSGAPVYDWDALPIAADGAVFMSRETILASERLVSGQVVAIEQTRWVMAFDASMDPDTLDVPKERRLIFPFPEAATSRTYDIIRARRVGTLGALIELVTQEGTKAEP